MKQITFVVVAALCAASMLWAATPDDFTMKILPANTVLKFPPATEGGGSVNYVVALDTAIDAAQGWSFGAILAPAAGVTMHITAFAIAGDTMTIKNGTKPDFASNLIFESDDLANSAGAIDLTTMPDGVLPAVPSDICVAITQGIVIDFMQGISLVASTEFETATFTVAVTGTMGDTAAEAGRVEFTGTVGNPPTPTVVVHGGGSIAPTGQNAAVITFEPKICEPARQFTMAIGGGGGGTDAEVVSTVSLNFNADPANVNSADVQGWSYGICMQDATKLDVVSATTDGTETATIKNGVPPDFNTVTVYPGAGVTHGVVIDFMAAVKLPAVNDWSDMAVTYKILMGAEGSTFVVPCDKTLGAPPTANVVVIGGSSLPFSSAPGVDAVEDCCVPEVCNAAGKFDYQPGKTVVAGSANGDGKLDIADGIYILNYLFRGGPDLPCQKAGDANGDCALDATDAIYIIYYQFLDGPAPVQGMGCVLITSDTCPALTCDVAECAL